MMHYALFNILNQAILQYVRLGKLNPWKLKNELHLSEYLPISAEGIPIGNKNRISLLNKSYLLYFLLYGLYLKVTKKV